MQQYAHAREERKIYLGSLRAAAKILITSLRERKVFLMSLAQGVSRQVRAREVVTNIT